MLLTLCCLSSEADRQDVHDRICPGVADSLGLGYVSQLHELLSSWREGTLVAGLHLSNMRDDEDTILARMLEVGMRYVNSR